METCKIVFASNNKFFSLLIKLGTLSRWCHVAILDNNDFVIDATLATGVRRIKFNEWVKHYNYYQIVKVPVESRKNTLEWARKQVGKKYDVLGIFSFILRTNIEEKDKFFCSEFIAMAVGITNRPWRLSPQWLYQFFKVIQGYLIKDNSKDKVDATS